MNWDDERIVLWFGSWALTTSWQFNIVIIYCVKIQRQLRLVKTGKEVGGRIFLRNWQLFLVVVALPQLMICVHPPYCILQLTAISPMVQIEGNNAGADDAVMLDKDGYVSETNATNIVSSFTSYSSSSLRFPISIPQEASHTLGRSLHVLSNRFSFSFVISACF